MRPFGDRGAVSIEVAVLAPAFIALIVLAGMAGRSAVAAEALDTAAHDAARAASISRDADTARKKAREAAEKQLDWQNLNCVGTPEIKFGGSVGGKSATFDNAFSSPVGEEASVTVWIECIVSYQDMKLAALPGMTMQNAVSASFTSPLDRYRSRG